jgi:type III restriction enzyme
VVIHTGEPGIGCYGAAVELAAQYRLDCWEIYDQLRQLYGEEAIPASHINDLRRQIEGQRGGYEVREETVNRELALVRLEGFESERDASGSMIYTAEIVYRKDRELLLMAYGALGSGSDFGFHYTPYNFDSKPEMDFFEQMLRELEQTPEEVEDIYFTGALTDPSKTDFYVEYKDDQGRWRRYTPDFVVRRKDGRTLIVEIKSERDREHPVDGLGGLKALVLRRWENLNRERLQYEMIFTHSATVPFDRLAAARAFVRGSQDE